MPPHRLDCRITSTQVRREGTEENEARNAREIGLAVRGSKGEALVIRSIVQANDAMIHQHKLIWPLQLCHAAVLYSENDRVHGTSTVRPSINSVRRLFPGPHRADARFSAINLFFFLRRVTGLRLKKELV